MEIICSLCAYGALPIPWREELIEESFWTSRATARQIAVAR